MIIIQRYKVWFAISIGIMITGILALIFWGLPLGIDFKGGSTLELKYSKNISYSTAQEALKDSGQKNLIIQTTKQETVIIKTEELTKEKKDQIKDTLDAKVGESGQEIRFENIGPTVGRDMQRKAIIAVILACFGIILYLAYAFRGVPAPASSWRFGVCAVAALIHDTIITIGMYSILAHFFGFEVDAYFITALLTLLGFSVHDTIVVFDRIRENLIKTPQNNFTGIVNDSIEQTIARSLNTSITVLIVLTALLVLGGSSIRHFIAILIVGIIIGTYSSIFNASPLLYLWHEWSIRRVARKNAS